MVKTWMFLLLTAALAACGSHPQATPEAAASDPEPGCYQAHWQAETNPVLNKRSGPDGLDKYETQTPTKEHGCP
ncbi:hypothetical protein LOY64_27760 [Pseudomonas corrugata]|uniref:Lipoprotein n=1 Tax=Pseudomonas corrugata TaxID=47879 RepID=A0A3M3EWL3_9PSED|nr:hypothetical protein [Pseudomonas corrugata]AOE62692.1 hypothetical protein AXG94_13305 [Pseudomonas corrugata]MDU9023653.1 hypothetical protein [Pseudomonas corrugata]MDU9034373.1 hypothetical protein [Pseudomonas corrugata]MDU9040612.1 hypothetical protein [Pseudomonas corrugata]QTH13925.1 hypothetical protein C4C32_25860 [Pseudomonas corrugata]